MKHLGRGLAVVIFTAAAALTACSSDPATRKQRFFESGNKYLQQGKYNEAAIEFRNAVQIDPRFGEARVRLAEVHARLGKPADALEEYVRAADILVNDVDVQLKAGHYLLAAARWKDAEARADQALKGAPQNVDAHMLRGNALAGQSDFDRALREIEEAIRLGPERGTSYTQLGFVELARGQAAEAEAAFKRAVEIAPKAIESHLALANFYWASGRLPEAEQAFRTAWTLDPKDPRANRAMAAFSLANGQTKDAEQYLIKLAEGSTALSAQFALTDYYAANGRTREAIDHLQKLVGDSPKVPELRERLARAYAASGDRAKAHTLIDEVLKAEPRFGRAQLFKARLLAEEGLSDEALARVRQTTDAEPTSIEAQFTLGRLYAARGDIAGAEKAFKEVLRLNPRAAAAQVELAHLQLASGRAAAGLQTAEAATRNLPENLDARLAVVRGLLATKDIQRADREIGKLLAEYPAVAAVHVQSGVLAAERKDPSGARAKFEQALRLQPDSMEALTGLVVLDLSVRDYAAAKARLAGRVNSANAPPEILMLAGRVYAASGEMEPAEKHLRRAIEVQPALLPAYMLLGQLYLAQKKLEQARQEFDNMSQRQSRPVAPLTMSGIILQTQGKPAEARKRYEQALASDPRAGVAANNLAWLYLESGEGLDLALQLAQTAVTAMPDAPEVLDTLGWAYYKKGLGALAVPPLARAVEKQPGNPTYRYHLGLAQLQQKDREGGRRSLQRALELNPSFSGAEDAHRKLSELAAGK